MNANLTGAPGAAETGSPAAPETNPVAAAESGSRTASTTGEDAYRVLLIDNDRDVAHLVSAMLTDEGYDVTTLSTIDHASVTAAVGREEPDCILLDSADGTTFGESWIEAAYLAHRSRPVPTVMFTAHPYAVAEARARSSQRSVDAGFAAIVPKPFTVDQLLEAVQLAAGRSTRFDRSEAADRHRTAQLVEELRAAGAIDIRTSERREWATFTAPAAGADRICQVYWWQRKGVYMVGRYDESAHLELVGEYSERSTAVAAALSPPPDRAADLGDRAD